MQVTTFFRKLFSVSIGDLKVLLDLVNIFRVGVLTCIGLYSKTGFITVREVREMSGNLKSVREVREMSGKIEM